MVLSIVISVNCFLVPFPSNAHQQKQIQHFGVFQCKGFCNVLTQLDGMHITKFEDYLHKHSKVVHYFSIMHELNGFCINLFDEEEMECNIDNGTF